MLEIGERVRWISKSRGTNREYEGVVIAYVPAYKEAIQVFRELFPYFSRDVKSLRQLSAFGHAVPSYLIEVDMGPHELKKVFCPHPRNLVPVPYRADFGT